MREMSKVNTEITSSEVPDPEPLPDLCGFTLLVRPVRVKEKTKGGIHLPDSVTEDLAFLTNVSRVLKVGPQAFKSDKFEGDEWCENGSIKVGDFVLHGKFDGEKIKYKGVNLCLIKDIHVKMRVGNPEDLDTSIHQV